MPVDFDLDVLPDLTLSELFRRSASDVLADAADYERSGPGRYEVIACRRLRNTVLADFEETVYGDRSRMVDLIRKWETIRYECLLPPRGSVDRSESEEETWRNFVCPDVFHPIAHGHEGAPLTVMVIGQPAAGVMVGKAFVRTAYPDNDLTVIDGDMLSAYISGSLGGYGTLKMSREQRLAFVDHMIECCDSRASNAGLDVLLENPSSIVKMLFGNAIQAHDKSRYTHAVVVATPAILSRAVLLDRFATRMWLTRGQKWWVSPEEHDNMLTSIAEPLQDCRFCLDRVTVLNWKGEVIADVTGHKKSGLLATWRNSVNATPDDETIDTIHACCDRARGMLRWIDDGMRSTVKTAIDDTLSIMDELRR